MEARTSGPEVKLDTTSHSGYAIFDVQAVDKDTKLRFELVVEDNNRALSEFDVMQVTMKDVAESSSGAASLEYHIRR